MKQYTLHPYQRLLLRAAWIAMFKQGYQSVLVQLATGGGKTIISAEFIDAVIRMFEWECMFFAHRREIIHQSAQKLAQADLMPGIIMRGDLYAPGRKVQVASIQSYLSWVARGKIAAHRPDLIVQDEAHSNLGKSTRAVLEQALKDGCKLLGLSATPVNKRGYGLANLYQTMVKGPSVQALIDMGFLVPVNYYMGIQPDVSGLKIIDGDYTEADLDKVMNHEALVGDIVDNWHRHSAGRPTIAFAASVAHSMYLAQQFRNAGLKAIHIDGTTDKKHVRDPANKDLAEGRLNVLCNYGTHVEGTDIPPVSCVIDACPSASLMRVLQKGGRGFRTSPATGKADLNYHDHSGNILRHGRLEMPRDWALTAGRENIEMNERMLKEQVIERVCPNCGFLFKGAVCLNCHEPYVPQGVEMEIVPATLAKMTYAELDAYVARKHKAKQASEAAIGQQRFYLEARGWCETHGKKDGFAYHAFKEKYGVAPRKEWQAMDPVMFTGQTESYMRSRLIKAAKGFAKRKLQEAARG